MSPAPVVIYEKKRHYGFLVFLIILLIIIVLPIGLVYFLLYDSTTKEVNHKEGETMEQFMDQYKENILFKSVANTKDNGQIGFSLDEGSVNTLLYYGLEENLDTQVKQYLNKAYLDIDANNQTYNIYVDASTPFFPYFKSRAQLVATVNKLQDGIGFEIKFTDAKVGRVGGLMWVIDQYVPEDMITGIFSNTGLSFNVDWKNKTISYNASNMLKDFGLDSGSDDNLFMSLIKEVFDNNKSLLNLDCFKNDAINFSLDLSSAHGASTPTPISFANTETVIRQQFHTGAISSSSTISDAFMNIAKNSTHEKPVAGKEITDCLDDNKNELEKTTYITETELNAYLRGTDLVGTTYPLYAHDNETNTNSINFITVNDFYSNIKANNEISFVINLNINGYDTQMVIDATVANRITDKEGETGHFFNFTMNNISYGDISMWDTTNDKPKAFIADLIESGFKSDDIKVEGKSIEIKVNSSDTTTDKMYSLTNEITTVPASGEQEAKVNVQIFTPNFKYGASNPPSASEYPAIAGDMWLNTTTFTLFTHDGTSWNLGESILSPTWQENNPELLSLIQDLGLIPTLP